MRRYLVLMAGLLWAVPLAAQQGTGTVVGKVVDATTQEPIPGVEVAVPSTPYRVTTGADGTFHLAGVPAGPHQLRATRIGYRPDIQSITVTGGGTGTTNFTMSPAAALLQEVVVTGYGTQRREAITGSVASISADVADVGVVPNVNTMLSGRAAGLNVTLNSGEPGANSQILIRGGTSLSASNEPLYVIDGVPINNVDIEAAGIGVGGGAQLQRNPLNMINPADIQSITVLKDAAAAAIYGSRAANGVILIETKKGGTTGTGIQYDGYVAAASPSRYLSVLDGNQYRAFVQQQVASGAIDSSALAGLGSANTNWERAVTRTGYTHNHDISLTGGTENTRYRASLNYMKQEGVIISSGLERIQARLNATHNDFDNRLRLALNITTSHVFNDYVSHQNTGGFEGDVLQNVVQFNPTEPIKMLPSGATDSVYYEIGAGSQSVRNPVALANQLLDFGHDTRTLGNASAEFDLLPGLTASINVGADRSSGLRQIYFPNSSPIGAPDGGLAQQSDHTNSAVTLQTLLTLNKQTNSQTINVVGGYEYDKYNTSEFVAEGHGYVSDAFTFNNLAGAAVLVPPTSFLEERKYVSFFGRANYGLHDRYFLTGVLRYDGASQFGTAHKWALFPALSASWHVSDGTGSLPDLKLRFGWGLQGNPAVPAYSSLLKLEPDPGGRAVFGQATVVTGVIPTSNPNPDLKWEQTAQWDGAVDFNIWNNRLSGTIEYYVKNTSDLLLDVPVPPPAAEPTRLENVGKTRNSGIEVSLDALPVSKRDFTWRAGVAFAADRNKVVDLGPYTFINTGSVSGQGQSNVFAERIQPGQPLGTFFGPRFVGWDASGNQLFACLATSVGCTNGQTTSPTADDYQIIGNANPDFTLGVTNQINAGKFDISFLINTWVGNDVFNNTALVYSTKHNAIQSKNMLSSALADPTNIQQAPIYSSYWIENGSFVRLQNLTIGYTFHLPGVMGGARSTRVYVSGDNLLLLTGYSGYDPEVYTDAGLATRGLDYLSYPRPRTFTAGVHVAF
jgi:TonB-linked SusC/RagA family outer membrane protein